MIIVSGLRAGLVIGLIVTPSKIQHDGSRWNKKFGSGGSSMPVGSADSQISPTSWRTSALVIPPIRNSATSSASAVSTHSRARRAAVMPTSRSLRMCPQTQSLASGLTSAPASSSSASNTSTPRSRITSQNVSCSALARDPQHVVEQQLLGVRRRQAGVLQPRPVDHDLAQPADLGMHSERHDDLLVNCRRAACRRAAFADLGYDDDR